MSQNSVDQTAQFLSNNNNSVVDLVSGHNDLIAHNYASENSVVAFDTFNGTMAISDDDTQKIISDHKKNVIKLNSVFEENQVLHRENKQLQRQLEELRMFVENGKQDSFNRQRAPSESDKDDQIRAKDSTIKQLSDKSCEMEKDRVNLKSKYEEIAKKYTEQVKVNKEKESELGKNRSAIARLEKEKLSALDKVEKLEKRIASFGESELTELSVSLCDHFLTKVRAWKSKVRKYLQHRRAYQAERAGLRVEDCPPDDMEARIRKFHLAEEEDMDETRDMLLRFEDEEEQPDGRKLQSPKRSEKQPKKQPSKYARTANVAETVKKSVQPISQAQKILQRQYNQAFRPSTSGDAPAATRKLGIGSGVIQAMRPQDFEPRKRKAGQNPLSDPEGSGDELDPELLRKATSFGRQISETKMVSPLRNLEDAQKTKKRQKRIRAQQPDDSGAEATRRKHSRPVKPGAPTPSSSKSSENVTNKEAEKEEENGRNVEMKVTGDMVKIEKEEEEEEGTTVEKNKMNSLSSNLHLSPIVEKSLEIDLDGGEQNEPVEREEESLVTETISDESVKEKPGEKESTESSETKEQEAVKTEPIKERSDGETEKNDGDIQKKDEEAKKNGEELQKTDGETKTNGEELQKIDGDAEKNEETSLNSNTSWRSPRKRVIIEDSDSDGDESKDLEIDLDDSVPLKIAEETEEESLVDGNKGLTDGGRGKGDKVTESSDGGKKGRKAQSETEERSPVKRGRPRTKKKEENSPFKSQKAPDNSTSTPTRRGRKRAIIVESANRPETFAPGPRPKRLAKGARERWCVKSPSTSTNAKSTEYRGAVDKGLERLLMDKLDKLLAPRCNLQCVVRSLVKELEPIKPTPDELARHLVLCATNRLQSDQKCKLIASQKTQIDADFSVISKQEGKWFDFLDLLIELNPACSDLWKELVPSFARKIQAVLSPGSGEKIRFFTWLRLFSEACKRAKEEKSFGLMMESVIDRCDRTTAVDALQFMACMWPEVFKSTYESKEFDSHRKLFCVMLVRGGEAQSRVCDCLKNVLPDFDHENQVTRITSEMARKMLNGLGVRASMEELKVQWSSQNQCHVLHQPKSLQRVLNTAVVMFENLDDTNREEFMDTWCKEITEILRNLKNQTGSERTMNMNDEAIRILLFNRFYMDFVRVKGVPSLGPKELIRYLKNALHDLLVSSDPSNKDQLDGQVDEESSELKMYLALVELLFGLAICGPLLVRKTLEKLDKEFEGSKRKILVMFRGRCGV